MHTGELRAHAVPCCTEKCRSGDKALVAKNMEPEKKRF
jgi:hypothetical protein